MKTADNLTAEEIKANAKEWYRRQCEISRTALGQSWEEHCEWIEAYLLQEVKERLAARGWRSKA